MKDDPLIPQWEERRGRPIVATDDAIADPEAVARFHAERTAFDHEHGRLYDALKVAQERAELAGDDDIASDIRILRNRVAQHIEDRRCR